MATVNLSVGAGTFQPVKVDNIEDHDIHSEYLEVSDEVVALVRATKKAGKESFCSWHDCYKGSWRQHSLKITIEGYSGYTKLFIYPGYYIQGSR